MDRPGPGHGPSFIDMGGHRRDERRPGELGAARVVAKRPKLTVDPTEGGGQPVASGVAEYLLDSGADLARRPRPPTAAAPPRWGARR